MLNALLELGDIVEPAPERLRVLVVSEERIRRPGERGRLDRAQATGTLGDVEDVPEDQPAQAIDGMECRPILAGRHHLLTEQTLAFRVVGSLIDGVLSQEVVGREVHVELLWRGGRTVETLAARERILPLRVGTRWRGGRDRVTRGLEAVRVTHERDHAVASRDVVFELFDQGRRARLEVLLHLDLVAEGREVAGEGVAAALELRRDGGEEDLHGARSLYR